MWVHVYARACMQTGECACVRAGSRACGRARMRVYRCACVRASMRLCVFQWLNVHIPVIECVYVYACICTCIYIHVGACIRLRWHVSLQTCAANCRFNQRSVCDRYTVQTCGPTFINWQELPVLLRLDYWWIFHATLHFFVEYFITRCVYKCASATPFVECHLSPRLDNQLFWQNQSYATPTNTNKVQQKLIAEAVVYGIQRIY